MKIEKHCDGHCYQRFMCENSEWLCLVEQIIKKGTVR